MRAYSFDKCFLGTIYVMDSALGTGYSGTKAAPFHKELTM